MERSLLYSPAWLIPVDILTAVTPPVLPRVALDLFDDGQWIPTGKQPTAGPTGVISYPGLGRVREPLTATPSGTGPGSTPTPMTRLGPTSGPPLPVSA